jgi:hypothetical protein
MFRSLRLTVEYTSGCFNHSSSQRVKENHGKGWITRYFSKIKPVWVFESERRIKLALGLGTNYCYIEIINPRFFPSYVRLNGRAFIIKKGKEIKHTQQNKTVVTARLDNTRHQNYYILVRAD